MGCSQSSSASSQINAMPASKARQNPKASLQQYYAYLTALPKLFSSTTVHGTSIKYLCARSVQYLDKPHLLGPEKKKKKEMDGTKKDPSINSHRTNMTISDELLDRCVMVFACTDTRNNFYEKVLTPEELFEIRDFLDVNMTIDWWKFFRSLKHCFLSKRVFLHFDQPEQQTGLRPPTTRFNTTNSIITDDFDDGLSDLSFISDSDYRGTAVSTVSTTMMQKIATSVDACNLTLELQIPSLGRTSLTLKLHRIEHPSGHLANIFLEPLYEFYNTKAEYGPADRIERLERQVKLYREKIQIIKEKARNVDDTNDESTEYDSPASQKELITTPHSNILKFLDDIRQKLEESGGMSDTDKAAFKNVIDLLSQDNMYSYDFNKEARKEVDKEVLTWLKHRFGVEKNASEKDQQGQGGYHRDLYLKTSDDFSLDTREIGVNKTRDAIKNMFKKVDDWNFDVFTLEELTDGQTLYITGYTLFMKYDLFDKFHIEEKTMFNFLRELEAGYHPNPYHNSMHAADVVQVLHHIIHRGMLSQFMRDEDILAALLSALIHDFDHPGLNNSFQVNTLSYLAVLYNDRSVMENHHCAQAFELIKAPQFDIFCNLEQDQKRDIRETIIGMVLATDMEDHAKYIAKFKQRIEATADFSSKEDLRLALQVAVKYADVSNPSRPTGLYLKWAGRLSDEFYRQGDKEKELNVPVGPLMDRNKNSMAKGQKMFIDYILTPMLESFIVLLPAMKFSQKFVNDNKLYWEKKEAKGRGEPGGGFSS